MGRFLALNFDKTYGETAAPGQIRQTERRLLGQSEDTLQDCRFAGLRSRMKFVCPGSRCSGTALPRFAVTAFRGAVTRFRFGNMATRLASVFLVPQRVPADIAEKQLFERVA